MPRDTTATDPPGAWPPDYVATYAWRQQQLRRIRADAKLLVGAKEYYRTRPAEFIDHWCDTYDPRLAGTETPARLPFRLFRRQREMIEFLHGCIVAEENGLVEKARDMGATWVGVGFSVWLWLFWPGASVGWGSRKEQLVDRLGDADSIFEKMRLLIWGLPPEFLPAGFSYKEHMAYMRIVNPETGATITGEAGDNIGRGGRKLIYFKDESAWYERPEKVEAALGDNTRVQIDISSVNGLGNVFHRRRESGGEWRPGHAIASGEVNVFVLDWRDHPAKDQAWYDARRAKAEREGLLHVFAQEVDRNYAAAVDGIIIPSEWVRSAIDAHLELGWAERGPWAAALDVADEGGDRNALAKRHGPVLRHVEEWGARDTGITTRRAIAACAPHGRMSLQYDAVGVGAGVKAEANRLKDDPDIDMHGLRLVPWNAGGAVLKPEGRVTPGDRDSPINKDFYGNLKAQAWWELRRRFEKTHRAITEGVAFDPDEMISLPSDLPTLRQVEKELSQPTMSKGAKMKLIVDKMPEGTRSPNMADAIVMAYWPADQGAYDLMAEGVL